MKRVIIFLLLLFISSNTLADEKKTAPDLLSPMMSNLILLKETKIPGEIPNVSTIPYQDIEKLLGRKVVRFEVEDGPAGFEPIKDIGLEPGMKFSRQLSRNIVLRLWETGKYRDASVKVYPVGRDKVVLVLKVAPMFRVSRVVVSGNRAMAESEIKRTIGYVPGMAILPQADAMISLRDRLLQNYAEKGYKKSIAQLTLETTDVPSEVTLIISIQEGLPERYSQVRLVGVDDIFFQRRLLRRSGLRDGIVRNETNIQNGFEKLLEALYEEGYPDAVVESYSEYKKDDLNFSLDIVVNTGLHTRVSIDSNRRLRVREIEEVVWGDPFFDTSAQRLLSSIARIEKFAVSKGLFHSRVYANRRCKYPGGRIRVVGIEKNCSQSAISQEIAFTVQEGLPVEVDHVLIEGAVFFGQQVLKDEIFAFMEEKNQRDEILEEFSSEAANMVNLGHNKNRAAMEYRGTRVPLSRMSLIYEPEKYVEVTKHLQEIYAEKGFLSAQVTDSCLIEEESAKVFDKRLYRPLKYQKGRKESSDVLFPCLFIDESLTSLVIKFKIDEGPQTITRNLKITGNNPDVFTKKSLMDISGIKEGEPYNEYFIRNGTRQIAQKYKETGYMFVDVSWESSLSLDNRSADVVIFIEEGPKVFVNEIIINAEVTNKKFIANNLGFSKGDIITPTLLERAQSRVMEMGIFDSASIQMQSPNTVSNQKNIVITVIERKSQYLELRSGVATEEGIRGGFEYGHRNILGLAINYRLRLRLNYRDPDMFFIGEEAQRFKEDLERRYRSYNSSNQGLTLPYQFRFFEWYIMTGFRTANIFGTRGILGTGLDVTFENLNRRGYSALKVTPRFRLTSNYLKFLPIELSVGFDNSIVIPSLDYESNDLAYSRLPSGRAIFFVTSLQLAFDFRDSPLNPKEGIFWSMRGDYVDSLYVTRQDGDAESKYFKASTTVSKYIPFSKKSTIWALSMGVGYIFHLTPDSITWADRQFYMGGVGTLRGFGTESLVAQDTYGTDWDMARREYRPESLDEQTGKYLAVPGGQAMFLLRSELRRDLASNVTGIVFFEAGNLWRNEELFLRNTSGKFRPFLLRPVSGLGVHYNTPVGPLAFDVGINIDKRFHEQRGNWFFSIGSAF